MSGFPYDRDTPKMMRCVLAAIGWPLLWLGAAIYWHARTLPKALGDWHWNASSPGSFRDGYRFIAAEWKNARRFGGREQP